MAKRRSLDPHPPSPLRILAMTLVVAMMLSLVLAVWFAGRGVRATRSDPAPLAATTNELAPPAENVSAPSSQPAPPAAIDRVDNGMTALMRAASKGDVAEVRHLLDHGANPNARGSKRRTALQYAAERDRIEVVRVLLAAGADINGYDKTRLTPLVMAVERGYTDLAKLLITAGADVNIAHVQGWTALIDAARTGNRELVDVLLQHGADVDAKMPAGQTAGVMAARAGHTKIAAQLRAVSRGLRSRGKQTDQARSPVP